ncbi:MAG: hypothetical protein HN704_03955 [Bacteroidetes bacterium]|nr:hypothetical protein [Bacteroidota bacterium]MBT7141779.1 hypothetical protein [Bacteroidota bacterium]MBT7490747.1 hypothetical protein [Bacteroidota bacterium]
MRLEDEFTYGKHKGKKIIDVFTGVLIDPIRTGKIIEAYLQDLLNLFSPSLNKHCIYFFNNDMRKVAKQNKLYVDKWKTQPNARFRVTQKYIFIENCKNNLLSIYMEFLNSIMNLNYTNNGSTEYWTSTNYPKASSSLHMKNINPNPSYIKWCIKHIDGFYICSDEIEMLKDIKSFYFENFTIEIVNDEILMYTPKIRINEYKISDSFIEMNRRKENEVLDDKYPESNNCENNQDTSYEQFDGPSDGYGGMLSDGFINDVLDGDSEAYWNVD